MKTQSPRQLYQALLQRCRDADRTVAAVRAENHRLREQLAEMREVCHGCLHCRWSRKALEEAQEAGNGGAKMTDA